MTRTCKVHQLQKLIALINSSSNHSDHNKNGRRELEQKDVRKVKIFQNTNHIEHKQANFEECYKKENCICNKVMIKYLLISNLPPRHTDLTIETYFHSFVSREKHERSISP